MKLVGTESKKVHPRKVAAIAKLQKKKLVGVTVDLMG